jgi:hypothetical protein
MSDNNNCPVKLLLAKKDILRCSKCPYIPFIELNEKNNNILVTSICQNNHKEEKPLKTYIEQLKTQNQNISFTCSVCKIQKKEKDILSTINYCLNCKNYICDKCKSAHEKEKSHQIILVKDLNSICPKHQKRFFSFCKNCHINICSHCLEEHESHNTEQLSKVIIEQKEIEKYKNLIKASENHINLIQNIMNTIINELKEKIDNLQKLHKGYEEINNLEIKFAKEIISTYQIEDNNKNMNYQIIINLRNNLKFSFVEIPRTGNSFIKAFKLEDYFQSGMNNILFTRKSGERRNSNLPKVIAALICNFENKNEEQKIYCLKLRDNIKYPGNIGYEIKSVTNEPFSIQLAFGGKIYTLQNEKKFTDDMLMSTLSKFYKLLRPVKPIIKK